MIVLFVKDLFSCVFNQETQMKACLFSTIIDRKQKLWKKMFQGRLVPTITVYFDYAIVSNRPNNSSRNQ